MENLTIKLYISDTGNEPVIEGVKITGDSEDLEFYFETKDDCLKACSDR